MKTVAFIPLRAGGSRVGKIQGRDKEIAFLGHHALLAYTVRAAINSGVFDEIYAVACAHPHIEIARSYGAKILERPEYTVKDNSPDIEWVTWALGQISDVDIFAILRVTSPFRQYLHIRGAHLKFVTHHVHSLRMVRPAAEHPGKMWTIQNGILLPLYPMMTDNIQWHSGPTQRLFPAYIQTAGMEFAWAKTVHQTHSISGSIVLPYVAKGWAGFDINTREDWDLAVWAVENGKAKLPEVT